MSVFPACPLPLLLLYSTFAPSPHLLYYICLLLFPFLTPFPAHPPLPPLFQNFLLFHSTSYLFLHTLPILISPFCLSLHTFPFSTFPFILCYNISPSFLQLTQPLYPLYLHLFIISHTLTPPVLVSSHLLSTLVVRVWKEKI